MDAHHISHSRLFLTMGVVLFAHLAFLYVSQTQPATLLASSESNQILMADVFSEAPAAVTTKTTATKVTADSKTTASSDMSAVASTSSSRTPSANLVEPSADADYLKNPPPNYPRASRRLGEQGTVIVRVLINAQGLPERSEIQTSSGFDRLDQAALEAVQRWRFVPGQRQGTPLAMWFNVPIRFILE